VIVERSLSRTLVRDSALVLAGAVVTALASQVAVPTVPVPITLQTLAVTACGLTLGMRRGAASQVTYLLMGAAGLPVFAEGKFGPQWLFGHTGGYLWAFIAAAALLGWIADRGWAKRPLALIGGMIGANALILLMGAGWLSLAIGLEKAWALGVLPFLIGAVIKSIAAIAVGVPSRMGVEHLDRK
jgi:biotin transport system substrate-specific component